MKYRKFQFVSPGYKDEAVVTVVTDWWIERMVLPFWTARMRNKGLHDQISLENCINDFCMIHWAVEL